MQRFEIHNDAAQVGVTAEGGHLDPVRFQVGGRTVAPMHVAPWADEPNLDPATPPILRILRGDFFCAPFGASDVLADETRVHGASANADWRLVTARPDRVELELAVPIQGATLHKAVHIKPGHAVIYQEHTFTGGSGALPIGHHAMLRATEPLRLSFSPRVWCGTPPKPLEREPESTSRLAYPQRFDSLSAVRLADGSTADLSTYPALPAHEDLLMMAADPAAPLAWTAAVAPQAGWVWFDLFSPFGNAPSSGAKRVRAPLSSTVLWMSHGGRRYAPWNGRHTHVLGIEEVTGCFHLGHRASNAPSAPAADGVRTAIDLRPGGETSVRYLFGVAAVPPDFDRVADIKATEAGLSLSDKTGRTVFAPCEAGFILPPGD